MISLVLLGKRLCRALIVGSMTEHIPFEVAGKPDRSFCCPWKSEISRTACMPVRSQWHMTFLESAIQFEGPRCTPITN